MAEMLMQELENRFPSSDILSAFGILYPQYWLQDDAEEAYPKHLQVLKRQYCGTRSQGAHGPRELPTLTCGELLSSSALSIQQSLFKVIMKAQAKGCMLPPFDKNPFTRLWDIVSGSAVLTKMIPEYLKLAEIGCTFVLGSVEDERTFSSLKFLKSRLWNRLEDKLPLVVKMHGQKFYTHETFPYTQALDSWKNVQMRYGGDA
jgi:hypothetical protein